MSKIATNKKSLAHQLKQELYRQYNRGKGISRHKIKLESGKFAHHDRIYSSNSLKTHLTQMKDFAKWAKEQPEKIRFISDITPELAGKYLHQRQEEGNSPHTISARLLAINHIGVTTQTFERPLKKADFGLAVRSSDTITNNRTERNIDDLTARQREIVQFGQAFGLRSSELVPNAHVQRYAVTNRSIYEHDNKIYLSTFGKGGRYRVVEVLKEKEDYIRAEYGQYIQSVNILPTKSDFREIREKATPLFDSMSRDVNVHVLCRQYYVNHKLDEIEKENREYHVRIQNQTKSGIETYSTNGRTMRRDHAQFISDQLGHARIYELKSYVNLN